MLVSSDINSANHNYPTNYNEAIYVAGALPDTAPNDTCTGPGGLPGIGDHPGQPPEAVRRGLPAAPRPCSASRSASTPTAPADHDELLPQLEPDPVRRQGRHRADGRRPARENTGQAPGAAGLLASFGREELRRRDPLLGQRDPPAADDDRRGRAARQHRRRSARPTRRTPGWDPHFGYGRVNLPRRWPIEAASRRRPGTTRSAPPEAQIDSPDWFAPINVDRRAGVGRPEVTRPRRGAALRRRRRRLGARVRLRPGRARLGLPAGPGRERHRRGRSTGSLGTLPEGAARGPRRHLQRRGRQRRRPARRRGSPTAPGPPTPTRTPTPSATPSRSGSPSTRPATRTTSAATARRCSPTATTATSPAGRGRSAPAPTPATYVTGSGGEVLAAALRPRRRQRARRDPARPRAASSTSLRLRRHAAAELQRRPAGDAPTRSRSPQAHPVAAGAADPARVAARARRSATSTATSSPRSSPTAGEHVYAWDLDGDPARRASRSASTPPSRSPACRALPSPASTPPTARSRPTNHIKRGFFGSPALADLDGDGGLDIVAGSLDQHLYAWDGDGDPLPGFPVKLVDPPRTPDGAEIVTSPAIAELDGEGPPEVVIATNEVVPGDPQLPDPPLRHLQRRSSPRRPAPTPSTRSTATARRSTAGRSRSASPPATCCRWCCPATTRRSSTATATATTRSRSPPATSLRAGPGSSTATARRSRRLPERGRRTRLDQGPVLNLADYPSVGDLSGAGTPGGGQGRAARSTAPPTCWPSTRTCPSATSMQAWDPRHRRRGAGYPRATDDFQLVSQAAIARVAGIGRRAPGARRHRPLPAARLRPQRRRGGRLAEVHRRLDAGDARGRRRRRRRRPRRRRAHPRGLVVPVGHRRRPACGGSNDEWWTFHHDEHGTANYGNDGRPPGVARGPRAPARTADGSVTAELDRARRRLALRQPPTATG